MGSWLVGLSFCAAMGVCGAAADPAILLIGAANHSRAEGFDARAEAQYRRALALIEAQSGSESVDLVPALNGLTSVLFTERRYTEAEAQARRSAALVESALGSEHPLLATSLNDLAAIYHVQGQYDKARPLYLRALAIREKTLGPEHPFVAVTRANLAELDRAPGSATMARKTRHGSQTAFRQNPEGAIQ